MARSGWHGWCPGGAGVHSKVCFGLSFLIQTRKIWTMKQRTKSGEPSGDTLPTLESRMAGQRAEIGRNQPSVGEIAAAFVAGHNAQSAAAVLQALGLFGTFLTK